MRRESPAALRNREPIRTALLPYMPATGRVVEVPCGAGVHSAWLSAAYPALTWIPADLSDEALLSTRLWRAEGGPHLQEPVRLDVTEHPWSVRDVDVVLAINLIHAAPPEVTPGLLIGASKALSPGGVLVLYGPFREGGVTAPSNEAFEAGFLHGTDPRWGLRELDDVTALALDCGMVREAVVEMPANNRLVVFRRPGVSTTGPVG